MQMIKCMQEPKEQWQEQNAWKNKIMVKMWHIVLLRKHKIMFENSCGFDVGKKF